MNEASDYPNEVCAIYQSRRDALCDGLARIGWDIPKPKGTMFVWAPIPEPYREMGSVEFCSFLVQECEVATSPGVGFGPGGEGFVRFALIENEQRIAQASATSARPCPSSDRGGAVRRPGARAPIAERRDPSRRKRSVTTTRRNSPFTEIP